MTAVNAARRGRLMAERQMTATGVVRRLTGFTEDGYELVPVYETLYVGRCKPQSFRAHESARVGPSGAVSVTPRSEVHFPVGAFVAQPGDLVTILESENPSLVGITMRAASDDLAVEHVTSYRVPVDRNIGEAVAPVEEG